MVGWPRAVLGLALGLTACSQPASAPSSEITVWAGWGLSVAQNPDSVLAVLDTDAEGWASLHRGALDAALRASSPVATRAAYDLHATEAVLVQLQAEAARELALAWSERAGLPPETALHTWAALAWFDVGGAPAELLALAPPPAAPEWAAVHAALSSEDPDWASLLESTPGPLGECLAAHASARATSAELAPDACPAAFLEEADGARTLPDPLAMSTRHAARTLTDPDPKLLSSTLFSSSWSSDDLGVPAHGPTAALLGLSPAELPEDALAQVQHATAMLDGWRPPASAPGARLFDDLDVVGVFRAHLLTDWAVRDLTVPAVRHEALRALLDADAGRGLGPTHPPRMLAAEALAAVNAGHVRSALPALRALEPLSHVLPELPALTELVNDLQVTSTLGRGGDSKEP